MSAVGIDLGTTFCAVAALDATGTPRVLSNAEGELLTPSVLYIEGDAVYAGSFARDESARRPENAVAFIKRHMGDTTWSATLEGRAWSATELSAMLLRKLKHDAEAALGRPVEEAVITVPAWFGDAERRATAEAGAAAGLNVLALLNEPTAAAFAYGLANPGPERRVLVLDLGGGTCDASIVAIAGRDIGVVTTTGDADLGGKDWDERIMAHAAGAFLERHGVDLRTDARTWHDLRQRCVAAKVALSRRDQVQLVLDLQGRVLRLELTRAWFEEACAPLLARVEALVRKAVTDAALVPADLSSVVLAGGSTRMPMVRDMVARVCGRPPEEGVNPDECVSMGASILAGMMHAAQAGETSPVDLRTQDVTGHSVSVLVRQGERLVRRLLIPRRTPLPAEAACDGLVTVRDGQTELDVWLVQGDGSDERALGCMTFHGLPVQPAGQRVHLRARHGVDGLIVVDARLRDGTELPHRVAAPAAPLADLDAGSVPGDTVLVLDASGSTLGPPHALLRAGAQAALERVRGPNRRFALVTCPGGLRVPFTADVGAVHAALRAIVPMGATPLASALDLAEAQLAGSVGTQRSVVVLTDGLTDEPDEVTARLARLARHGVSVSAIFTGTEAASFSRLLDASVVRTANAPAVPEYVALSNIPGEVPDGS
jgi:molecular chaperone DnaK